jgi:hypothetical protein
MQAAIDQLMAPACSGCGSTDGVASSVHAYRGPYFCICCCNYLDKKGRLVD